MRRRCNDLAPPPHLLSQVLDASIDHRLQMMSLPRMSVRNSRLSTCSCRLKIVCSTDGSSTTAKQAYPPRQLLRSGVCWSQTCRSGPCCGSCFQNRTCVSSSASWPRESRRSEKVRMSEEETVTLSTSGLPSSPGSNHQCAGEPSGMVAAWRALQQQLRRQTSAELALLTSSRTPTEPRSCFRTEGSGTRAHTRAGSKSG
jgi:hypothetical protein